MRAPGHRTPRTLAAAALVAAGRDADDMARAQAALRRAGQGHGRVRNRAHVLFSGGLMLAVSGAGFDVMAQGRRDSIRREFPDRWWRASPIGEALALDLALRGLDGAAARARLDRAEAALAAAGVGGWSLRKTAVATLGFAPDPAVLTANFASLRSGRAKDRRLRMLGDPHYAALAAAAPDKDALYAALSPMLDAAGRIGWAQGRPVKASVAKGLALAALGAAGVGATMSELLAILAQEAAALAAAGGAAAAGAAASG